MPDIKHVPFMEHAILSIVIIFERIYQLLFVSFCEKTFLLTGLGQVT